METGCPMSHLFTCKWQNTVSEVAASTVFVFVFVLYFLFRIFLFQYFCISLFKDMKRKETKLVLFQVRFPFQFERSIIPFLPRWIFFPIWSTMAVLLLYVLFARFDYDRIVWNFTIINTYMKEGMEKVAPQLFLIATASCSHFKYRESVVIFVIVGGVLPCITTSVCTLFGLLCNSS